MTDRFLTEIAYRCGEFQFARRRVSEPFVDRAIEAIEQFCESHGLSKPCRAFVRCKQA